VLNPRTSSHRRHPSSPRSMVLSAFQTPPTFLPLMVGGGGGGSEKWFSPTLGPPNVARPHHFRPPLLILLTTYPPLINLPNHHPYTAHHSFACSHTSSTTYSPPLNTYHLSSTLPIPSHLPPVTSSTSLTTPTTRHLPLIIPLSSHTTCPLIPDTVHLSAYTSLLPNTHTPTFTLSIPLLDTCPHVIISVSQLNFPT
jgi:hypothetical protein